MPVAFIIHGRDLAAHNALAKFLVELGLTVRPFEDTSVVLGPTPFISDVVLTAMRKADVIIALFTPDEQASHYEPVTGRYVDSEHRWQARQNVIYEAGVAFGLYRQKTVLTTLGPDVHLFSDVGGIHIVELGEAGGCQRLANIIRSIVPNVGAGGDGAARIPNGVNLVSVVRKRWRYFDEVDNVLDRCAGRLISHGASNISLLEVMKSIAATTLQTEWSTGRPWRIMAAVQEAFGEKTANRIHWWLLIYGVFEFEDDEHFFDGSGNEWKYCVIYWALSPRAVHIWERLRAGVH